MTDSGREKVAARELASELDIRYAHALRLLRTARETSPRLRGTDLRNACKAILDKERAK